MSSSDNPPSYDNPFPGLRPFRTDECHLFFGREEQTDELLRLLSEQRFLAVVGTSGSGKSSLVRAGLIPELHRGVLSDAGSSWEVVVLRPGGNPIANLARALVEGDLYDPDDPESVPRLRATLGRSRLGLIESIRQSQDLPPRTNLLIVVDQFEELFRFRQQDIEAEETATAFVNLLLTAAESPDDRIFVAITMRSDYLGDCSEIPGLAEAVNRGEYLIPRLLRDQKQEAIEKPVGVGGARIASRLVQRMLNQVGDDPDQLPVLQHALMRTWEVWRADHAPDEPIDLRHFEATGGMEEALSRHADEIFEALPDEEHRRICERAFKALTEKGADNRGIRRPTRLDRLAGIARADRRVLVTVLDAFRCPGVTFVMPGLERELADGVVLDLSHESLMRVWRRLRAWVEEEAQSARIYARLVDTAELWREGKASLFRDPDLQIALSWRATAEPNEHWALQYGGRFDVANEFLDRSGDVAAAEERERERARERELEQAKALAEAENRRAHERERAAKRLRALATGAALIAVAAVGAFFLAWVARGEANESARLAKENERAATQAADALQSFLVQSDFSQGAQAIEEGESTEGLAFVARALRNAPDHAAARARAISTLASGRFRFREPPSVEQEQPISNYRVNRQEDLILASNEDLVEDEATAERAVFDLRTGEQLYRVNGGSGTRHPRWAVDGSRLYGVDESGRHLLGWDARSGEEVWRLDLGSSAQVMPFAVGEHAGLGALVLVRYDDSGECEIFSVRTSESVSGRAGSTHGNAMAVGFSPDATLFWTWHTSNRLIVRETLTKRELLETTPVEWDWYVWISPDNSTLFASTRGGKSVGWWSIPRAGGAESPGGAELPARPENGWVRDSQGVDLYVLPSGRKLATLHGSGSGRFRADVYDIATRERTARFEPTPASPTETAGEVVTRPFVRTETDDPRRLRFPLVCAIESASPSSVVVWDLESGETLERIRTPWFLTDAVLSTDGLHVATVSQDDQVMVWSVVGGAQVLSEAIDYDQGVTVDFSSNGAELLTSVWSESFVEFRDTFTGSLLFEPLRGTSMTSVEFSRDGSRAAIYRRVTTTSGGSERRVTEGRFTIADAARRPIEFEELVEAPGRVEPVAAYANAGQHIVVSTEQPSGGAARVTVFDPLSRQAQRTLPFSSGVSIRANAVTPNGRRAVVLTSEERAYVVDVASGAAVREIVTAADAYVIDVSADGSRLAVGSVGGGLEVFDLETGARVGERLQHGTEVLFGVKLTGDGTRVASASQDYGFRLAEVETGREVFPPLRLANVVLDIVLLDGGSKAAVVPFEEAIPIVDLESGRVVRTLRNAQPCLEGELSPAGDILALGGGNNPDRADGVVTLWDWRTGQQVGPVLRAKGQVRRLAFSSDGRLLASGTSTGRDSPLPGVCQVWDVESGRELTDPIRGVGSIDSIAFDPSGPRLVAAWRAGAVRVIDLPPSSGGPSEWIPALIDAATGKRLAKDKHSVEELTSEERAQSLEAVHSLLEAATGDDPLAAWGRWLLTKPAERTISPGSSVTLAEHLRRKAGSEKLAELREALRLAPTDGTILARYGLALLSAAPTELDEGSPQLRHWRDAASFFVSRATEVEPRSSEVWALRAEFLDRIGRRDEARAAIARAEELEVAMSANVSYLRAISLARDGEWEEADDALDAALDAIHAVEGAKESGAGGTPVAPLSGVLAALEPVDAGLDFQDVELPEPIPGTFEDFDSVAEGALPDGWTTPRDALGPRPLSRPRSLSRLDDEGAPDWVVVDADRVSGDEVVSRGQPGRLEGRVPTTLMSQRFLYVVPRQEGASRPERSVETRDFDLRGRRDVHLAFHSAFFQQPGRIGAVEYSIDGGESWLPVAYLIDTGEFVRDADGRVDAVGTLEKDRDTLPWFLDDRGRVRGRAYGDHVRAPIVPELRTALRGRRSGGWADSKRIEVFRLPAADGAERVRVRFGFVAPAAQPAWGIDRFGLYEIPSGQWVKPPGRLDFTSDSAVLAGLAVETWRRADRPSPLASALGPEALLTLPGATSGLDDASYIWWSKGAEDRQEVFFRRTFDVSGPVRGAFLLASGDDQFEAWINGEQVTQQRSWRALSAVSVGRALRPGRNVLAVRCYNGAGAGGLLARLEGLLEDGTTIGLSTDDSWRAADSESAGWRSAEFDDSAWPRAVVLGPYGVQPWGHLFGGEEVSPSERAAALLLVRRAARLAPEDPWVLLASAYLHGRADDSLLERAFADAGRALELAPPGATAASVLSTLWTLRGDALLEGGAGHQAAVAYELAHALVSTRSSTLDPSLAARLASVRLAEESRFLVPRGAAWRFLGDGPFPDSSWMSPDFDDSTWSAGPAPLGYGDAHIRTSLRALPTDDERRISAHFRADFELDAPSAYPRIVLRLLRDDGAVVYLNGHEIARVGMPDGAIRPTTFATINVFGGRETEYVEVTIDRPPLVRGRNVVAVEVHQINMTSSDLGFDLEIEGLGDLGSWLPDFAELESAEESLELSPALRGLLWCLRGTRLARAGELERAEAALDRARRIDSASPRLHYETAILQLAQGEDEAAYRTYVEGVRRAIEVKGDGTRLERLALSEPWRIDIEPLLDEEAMGLANAANRMADLQWMSSKWEARALLRRAEVVATDHEGRLAIANTWPSLDATEALSRAETALAGYEGPPAGPRAIRERRDWLRLRERCLRDGGRVEEAERVLEELLTPPPRPADLDESMIDLSAWYSVSLYDGRWHVTSPSSSLRLLPETWESTGRVPFDLRGLLQLDSGVFPTDSGLGSIVGRRASELAGRPFAERIDGIVVGRRARRLHFLGGAIWGRAELDEVVATIVVRYEDGSSSERPVRYWRDIHDWAWPPRDSSLASVAWQGRVNSTPRYLTAWTWENPTPEKLIASFDFVSAGASAAPFLIAVTAEE